MVLTNTLDRLFPRHATRRSSDQRQIATGVVGALKVEEIPLTPSRF
jgi:hypothetical protein